MKSVGFLGFPVVILHSPVDSKLNDEPLGSSLLTGSAVFPWLELYVVALSTMENGSSNS